MESSDALSLLLLSSTFLVLRHRKRKEIGRKKKSPWVLDFLKTRDYKILKQVNTDDLLFKNFTRMSKANFDCLLNVIRAKIEKKDTRFREAIPPGYRLAITLRFLATGDSIKSLFYLFKVSKQTISEIIPIVLRAIIEALQDYIKIPANEQGWKSTAAMFDLRWNFPHCIGALDGKHIVIRKPENAVSEFYNYQGDHSIVLLAIVDANYCFTRVNVGCQGRISDGGVFKHTNFYRKLQNDELNLPLPEPLPGREIPVPYVIVADDAFALETNIMKPFSTDLSKGSPKRIFNYRLSKARRIVENAFGLLASVFRIFRKPIEIKVETTIVDIVLACVYLHNFLRSQPDSARYYSPPGSFDHEDPSTGEIISGTWRATTAHDSGMRGLQQIPRHPPRSALNVREEFMNYFMSPQGAVTFQNNK